MFASVGHSCRTPKFPRALIYPLGTSVLAVDQRHYSFLGFSGQVITFEILLLA